MLFVGTKRGLTMREKKNTHIYLLQLVVLINHLCRVEHSNSTDLTHLDILIEDIYGLNFR